MESEDEMLDAWAGTSDGEFQNKEEEEELDALASDDENDGSDYGFDYSNIDDIQPSSRLPQVFVEFYSTSGFYIGRFWNEVFAVKRAIVMTMEDEVLRIVLLLIS